MCPQDDHPEPETVDSEIEFRVVPADDRDAVALIGAMVEEMRVLYDGLDLEAGDMPKAGPAELGPPHGAFVVGYLHGRAVCGGGVKRLPDGVAEIKRMYVVPDLRGRGVARALLARLEDEARSLGYSVVRLDTGERQPQAIHLYGSAGYREIANYNDNPAAGWFGEKQL
ncbi:MAG: GNAT family N-acetyltransferase [Acidimicrobiales bacterium]|nr:GNAT family N-acetyltransferase [Acidimicrobiales bacterium]